MAAAWRLRWVPDGLPELSGALFILYCLAWPALVAAALAVQIMAAVDARASIAGSALAFVQAAVLIAVSMVLVRRRPRDPVAAMLSLAFLIWAVTSVADGHWPKLDAWVAALDRVRFVLLVGAVLLFPAGRFEPWWTAPVLAATVIVFLIGMAGTIGLLPAQLFLPAAIACVAAAIASLAVRLRAVPPGTQRQQLKWVAFGLAAGLALILLYRIGTAVAPAQGFAAIGLEAAFRLGVMLMALGFLVSLLRYRLYDAEAAISRSAAYLSLTLALVAIFAGSEAVIGLFGQRYLGMQVGDLSGGIAAAIAAMLIAPLHERMMRWAERRFQRDLVVLRQELPAALADAQEQADLPALSAILLPRVEAGVRAMHVALAIEGDVVAVNDIEHAAAQSWLESWCAPNGIVALDRDPDDALFPLRVPLTRASGGPTGWVLLGPRPDGSFYGPDELEALAEIAVPLRRAIVAIREREAAAAETLEWKENVLASLAELAERIDRLEFGCRRQSPKPAG